jgi:hypothetical protein
MEVKNVKIPQNSLCSLVRKYYFLTSDSIAIFATIFSEQKPLKSNHHGKNLFKIFFEKFAFARTRIPIVQCKNDHIFGCSEFTTNK